MPFAPDPREAFDMALLRMSAFRPQGQSALAVDGSQANAGTASTGVPASATLAEASRDAAPELARKSDDLPAPKPARGSAGEPASDTAVQSAGSVGNPVKVSTGVPPAATPASLAVRGTVSTGGSLRAATLAAARGEPTPPTNASRRSRQRGTARSPSKPATTSSDSVDVPIESARDVAADSPVGSGTPVSTFIQSAAEPSSESATLVAGLHREASRPGDWQRIVTELDLAGMPRQLADNCELVSMDSDQVALRLEADSEHLNKPRFCERLQNALSQWLGKSVHVKIELVQGILHTPSRIEEKLRLDEMAAARVSIDQDPVVRQLIERVDGAVDETSIAPIGNR
jgi:DNA polymerase-3 subunit gamma/tau